MLIVVQLGKCICSSSAGWIFDKHSLHLPWEELPMTAIGTYLSVICIKEKKMRVKF